MKLPSPKEAEPAREKRPLGVYYIWLLDANVEGTNI